MVRWISKISVSFSEACIPDSEKACLDAINSLGLEQGGRGYAFAGDYGTKGCYAYEAENTKYGNMAFYGTGGSEDEMKTILAKPQYRPMIDSCGVTGLFWFFMQIFVVIIWYHNTIKLNYFWPYDIDLDIDDESNLNVITVGESKSVDCQWDEFGEWSSCSKTCGSGEKLRSRSKVNEEENGGVPCIGKPIETEVCSTQQCPVDNVVTKGQEQYIEIDKNVDLVTSTKDTKDESKVSEVLKNSRIALEGISKATSEKYNGKWILDQNQNLIVIKISMAIQIFIYL